ncbi:MAG TPA: PH domain-containing protein [Rickettsiales bacterium]|nr:PH domain-containing protein [Rickettsiales bacterium]
MVFLEENEQILYTGRASVIAYIISLLTWVIGGFSALPASEITVTNKRLYGKRGLLFRRPFDLPFSQIVHVWFKQGMLGMLFNYGTLIIATQDERKIRLKAISDPSFVKHTIEEVIEAKTLGHTLSEYTSDRF